jgi:glycosyltransferase involved in cell wall biosynthesis
MALSAKWKYNIPLVGIEHFSSLGKKEIWNQILERAKRTYKYLDILLTVSNSLRDNIRKQLNVDSIVVHNMVGKEFYYQDSKQDDGVVRFIAVGNLLPVKGYDILIDAFNEVHISGKWMLDIIGGGPEFDRLSERVKDYGLGEHIHLQGRKDRQTVIRYLHESDVYILSSRLETFGVAALEALACGIPVIATECGGPTEFINEMNGVTCPVEDVDQLARSILYMYNHYKDYNRKKIADDCQKRFSSEAIGKQLENIFEEVIRKSKQQ